MDNNSLKGVYDERDDYRYIYYKDSFCKDEVGNLTFEARFNIYQEDMFIKEYLLVRSNETAKAIYDNWTDLKCAYELLINEIGIEVELPESMDWELFN